MIETWKDIKLGDRFIFKGNPNSMSFNWGDPKNVPNHTEDVLVEVIKIGEVYITIKILTEPYATMFPIYELYKDNVNIHCSRWISPPRVKERCRVCSRK